ncbi:MAG: GTPase ObgE [Spirochaetota bacterium]|nr:MAG: GTPase ObgE [Spirochaetota bacterium]
MSRFVDEAKIVIKSGHGGKGAVSFRREKYVPKGGPDGGDGGDGGDVIFKVSDTLRSLYDHKLKRIYKAKDGKAGSKNNKKGPMGEACIIFVPPGTVILEKESNRILADLAETSEVMLLKGGKGGYGNARFSTSTNQTPRYAQEGKPGRELELLLQIKTIADIGIVGLPNAGKSTLLSVLTEAKPKVGAYPFTTLSPNLGIMNYKNVKQVVIADVPGLIEGASRGIGLGIRFLKHIERTRALIMLIDLVDGDFSKKHEVLLKEMGEYSDTLLAKPLLFVGSKLDAAGRSKEAEFLKSSMPGEKLCISSLTRANIDILENKIVSILEQGNGLT